MQEQGDEEAEERDASREAQDLASYMRTKYVPSRVLPALTPPPTATAASKSLHDSPDVSAIHIDDHHTYRPIISNKHDVTASLPVSIKLQAWRFASHPIPARLV